MTLNSQKNTAILSDQMVLIGTTQSRSENYFRLLKVLDSKGNELHLITMIEVYRDTVFYLLLSILTNCEQ